MCQDQTLSFGHFILLGYPNSILSTMGQKWGFAQAWDNALKPRHGRALETIETFALCFSIDHSIQWNKLNNIKLNKTNNLIVFKLYVDTMQLYLL